MASTTFSNGTTIVPAWLNAVNLSAYTEKVDIKADPYSATGDGVADDLTAWSTAISTGKTTVLPAGTYRIGDYFRPADGSNVFIKGVDPSVVTVRPAASRISVYCDASYGTNNRVQIAVIEGVTFDGGHTRTPANYPYNSDPGASATQAFNLRGSKGQGTRSVCIVRDCVFQNFNGLPFWIADFDYVLVTGCRFYRCKDPGILFCEHVVFSHNKIEFSADNGVSISRCNKHVHIHDNTVLECASSGIFVGGVKLPGTGTMTATGTYTVGGAITLSLSGSNFTTEDIGMNIVLRSGADRALVRILAVTGTGTATGTAMVAVPASLQGVGTTDWARYVSGGQSGSIHDNVIIGGSNYGIHLNGGCKNINIHNNTILRTGITADSEVYTTCSGVSGSTSLTVGSSTNFATNDWVVIIPEYTMEDYAIRQVTNIVGTTFTLNSALPSTYAGNSRVYRAYRRTAAYGILAIGSYESTAILEFAERLKITNNTIVDSVTGGLRLGSSSGSIRHSQIYDNQVYLSNTAHVESTIYGILIGDSGQTYMRSVNLKVRGNYISLTGTGGDWGVRYNVMDTNVNSYITIKENIFREVSTNVSVVEQAGGTTITSTYQPESITGSLPTQDLAGVASLGLSSWQPATQVGGVLTVTQSLNTYSANNGGATTNITDIVFSGINHDAPVIVVRNNGNAAGDTITFVYDANKIRTLTGANVVIPRFGSAVFVPISSTLVQQIG